MISIIGKFSKKEDGLTLMGVIFSIGIILVGLLGILSLLRYVIVAGRISGDRFIATNLAQEGIEIVRAIRDDNWKEIEAGSCDPLITPDCWRLGLAADVDGIEYQVQYKDPVIEPYSASPLTINDGYYAYGPGQNSKYTRRIIIYYPDGDPGDDPKPLCPVDSTASNADNFCVVSEVTWQALGSTYSAVVEDRLYNWR